MMSSGKITNSINIIKKSGVKAGSELITTDMGSAMTDTIRKEFTVPPGNPLLEYVVENNYENYDYEAYSELVADYPFNSSGASISDIKIWELLRSINYSYDKSFFVAKKKPLRGFKKEVQYLRQRGVLDVTYRGDNEGYYLTDLGYKVISIYYAMQEWDDVLEINSSVTSGSFMNRQTNVMGNTIKYFSSDADDPEGNVSCLYVDNSAENSYVSSIEDVSIKGKNKLRASITKLQQAKDIVHLRLRNNNLPFYVFNAVDDTDMRNIVLKGGKNYVDFFRKMGNDVEFRINLNEIKKVEMMVWNGNNDREKLKNIPGYDLNSCSVLTTISVVQNNKVIGGIKWKKLIY